MLFNSQVFILLFLPLTWLVFDTLRRRGSGFLAWLLVASLVFYVWWEPRDLPILAFSILGNYLLGRRLGRVPGRPPRFLLGAGVAANLGLIGWFKYRGLAAASLGDLGLEVMMPAFDRVKARDRRTDLAVGLAVFSIGLAKKVLLADSLAPIADGVFDGAERGATPVGADAWLGTLAYGLQLYFDFSAYSDMALGIARMFGIDLPINFLSPYRARNIAEFWR
jgi:alginate O-acetyltransferase complex protein AlgI